MRVLAATDRSETADHAVRWAADLARRYEGELLLLQVVPDGVSPEDERSLAQLASELAGERGRALVVSDPEPATAIVAAAERESVDLLVVGNAGMGGRKEFLLGNVPNRVSHTARCSVVILNTTAPEAPPAKEPAPPQEGDAGALLGRAARVGRVIAKYGLEERFAAERASPRERARRLRAALEELGPTFAKLGQILSTRPDLLPRDVVDELAKLQDDVTPLSEREVVAVMEQELGVPWEDVFASIDPEPLAAGTIGQVHRATLETGARVVVKIQRPTARDDILADLGLLEAFADKAAERPGLRGLVDVPAVVEHLSTSLRRELDFRQEAENADRMREVLASYDHLEIPSIYHDLSTSRFLVMEEVQGLPLREAPEGEARRDAARQLLEAYYRQVLHAGFFHADPHPGNLLWWKDSIYFLDLGMVGEVTAEVRELMTLLLVAFFRQDAAFLTEALLMLSGEEQPADLDLETLERDFGEFIGRFSDLRTLRDIQIGPMLEGLATIAAQHGMRLPAALTLAGKAFGQMQLAAAHLDPALEPGDVVNSFLMRSIGERVRGKIDPRELLYETQKLKLRFTRVLEAVERASGARPGQRLQVEFLGAAAISDEIRRTGRRLAVAGVASAALAAALAGWAVSRAAGGR